MSRTRLQDGEYRKIVTISADKELTEQIDECCRILNVKKSVFVRSCIRYVTEQFLKEVKNSGKIQ